MQPGRGAEWGGGAKPGAPAAAEPHLPGLGHPTPLRQQPLIAHGNPGHLGGFSGCGSMLLDSTHKSVLNLVWIIHILATSARMLRGSARAYIAAGKGGLSAGDNGAWASEKNPRSLLVLPELRVPCLEPRAPAPGFARVESPERQGCSLAHPMHRTEI